MVEVNEEAVLATKLVKTRIVQHIKDGYGVADIFPDVILVAMDAAKLKSMARAVGRLDEAQCNRDLTEREEMRRTKLLQAIRALAAEYGITKVDHNSDPRGYAVYLHFPDGRGNSWGGDERGWGI